MDGDGDDPFDDDDFNEGFSLGGGVDDDDVDNFYEDALDFFALCLIRMFPAIRVERIQTRPWREGWKIFLPQGFTQRQALIDAAVKLQNDLYMKKDFLVVFKLTTEEPVEEGTFDC
jgi:hypothetical protein